MCLDQLALSARPDAWTRISYKKWTDSRGLLSVNDKGERKGGQLIACWFESEAEGYSWLNDTVCVAEGVIDPATMSMRLRVYSLDNGLIS